MKVNVAPSWIAVLFAEGSRASVTEAKRFSRLLDPKFQEQLRVYAGNESTTYKRMQSDVAYCHAADAERYTQKPNQHLWGKFYGRLERNLSKRRIFQTSRSV